MSESDTRQPIGLESIRNGQRIEVHLPGKDTQYLTVQSGVGFDHREGGESVIDVVDTVYSDGQFSTTGEYRTVPTGEIGLTPQRSGPSVAKAYIDRRGK
ncbi:hypothetical protein I8H83_04355 [Candidatus Saccharibacteria bacterium]|nr:hypothetical protein [Candidatus Saccharibacteria bacterium]